MNRTTTAQAGDTLCTIAIRNGFKDCRPLRKLPENKGLIGRDLAEGDEVTLPQTEKGEDQGQNERRHKYQRPGVPPPQIRFIRDFQQQTADAAREPRNLEVSNFVCINAGPTGTASFKKNWGFDADADSDLDTFKVEIVDPGAKAAVVKAQLRALRPRYGADGRVVGHAPFTTSDAGWREITIDCRKLPGSPVRFRSRYLRLVTDEADLAALSGTPGSTSKPPKKDGSAQGLLVADCADGQGGENDATEILDQAVEASHPLAICTFKDSTQCVLRKKISVGDAVRQERIRLAVHVFRDAPGSSRLIGGLTPEMIRKRIMKWVRRAYAQAHRAPKVVAPFIELLDPPSKDTLVIGDPGGTPAFGKMIRDGQKKDSTLSLKLKLDAVTSPAGTSAGQATAFSVSVRLRERMFPKEVAEALAQELKNKGVSAKVCPNPAIGPGLQPSCDLMISRPGFRVQIEEAKTDDKTKVSGRVVQSTSGGLSLEVPTLNLNQIHDDTDGTERAVLRHPEIRRILRSAQHSDKRIDVFVIGSFQKQSVAGSLATKQQQGTSQFFHRGLPAGIGPAADLRGAVIVSAAVMDGSDFSPFTLAHEIGHVALESGHTVERSTTDATTDRLAATELMQDGEASQMHDDSVGAPKRICEEPLSVHYAFEKKGDKPPFPTEVLSISAVKRLSEEQARTIFEPWPEEPWRPPGDYPLPDSGRLPA